MKVKSANNMYNKFVSILNEECVKQCNSTPELIQTDEGTEFALVKKSSEDIQLFHTHNREMKGSMVERLVRELKWMMRFTVMDDENYMDYLDVIVEHYNELPHSSLGDHLSPCDVY